MSLCTVRAARIVRVLPTVLPRRSVSTAAPTIPTDYQRRAPSDDGRQPSLSNSSGSRHLSPERDEGLSNFDLVLYGMGGAVATGVAASAYWMLWGTPERERVPLMLQHVGDQVAIRHQPVSGGGRAKLPEEVERERHTQ